MPPLVLSEKFNMMNLNIEASRQIHRPSNQVRVQNKSLTRRNNETAVGNSRSIVAKQANKNRQIRAGSQPRQQKTLQQNLVEDFGSDIQVHLKKMEAQVNQQEFLGKHSISADYRAKMVDWMIEVLTTFKNSEQSLYLAVNLMDRYFKETTESFSGSELHIAGIVSMFIATKYEDVIPLLMKTVVNKISHNKFDVRQIEDKELQVLKTLGFKIGCPTIKEFIDRLFIELSSKIEINEQFRKLCSYLAKMTCYSYKLQQVKSSLLAGAIIMVAAKLTSSQSDMEAISSQICEFSNLHNAELQEVSQEVQEFAQSFDKIYPNLKNLRTFYQDEASLMKQQISQ